MRIASEPAGPSVFAKFQLSASDNGLPKTFSQLRQQLACQSFFQNSSVISREFILFCEKSLILRSSASQSEKSDPICGRPIAKAATR